MQFLMWIIMKYDSLLKRASSGHSIIFFYIKQLLRWCHIPSLCLDDVRAPQTQPLMALLKSLDRTLGSVISSMLRREALQKQISDHQPPPPTQLNPLSNQWENENESSTHHHQHSFIHTISEIRLNSNREICMGEKNVIKLNIFINAFTEWTK